MVVREETRPSPGVDASPAAFRTAVAGLRAATMRPEVFVEEMPAPQRIAPYATALSADVTVAGEGNGSETDVATGRLILLHDPDGNDAWAGRTFRLVAYVRAELDVDLITDQMLGEVGWTWLTEALDAHGAAYVAASGTVTRVVTESFGGMSDEPGTAQIEIRASWTPVETGGERAGKAPAGAGDVSVDVRPHVEAWGELLCTAAGLPPVPEGVAIIPSRRGQRGA